MKKFIWAFLILYLAAVFESSFWSYFLFQGRGLGLILITFLSFLLLSRWSISQEWALGIWTGFLLDVFCYPGFGPGLLTILLLLGVYQISRRWLRKPKRVSGIIIWFLALNLFFYLIIGPLSFLLAGFIYPSLRLSCLSLENLGLQLFYNSFVAGLVFFFCRQGRKIFFR